uniref:PH domain-containing protein n=1 Tax=Romanomermis culicivorax TaxID=13658 RepID=A0A915JU82_ROMCU
SLPRNSFYRPDEYQQQTEAINAKNNNNSNFYAENQSPNGGVDYRSNNLTVDQIDYCFLRSSSSPNHKKPVPKPRTNKSSKNSVVGESGRLISNSSNGGNENNNDADRSCYFSMERDSLEPNINYANMSNNNDNSSGKYKNNEKSIVDTDQYLKDKAKLEQQLYDLAQSCFMPSTSTNGKRDTYVPGDPKHKSSLGRSTTIDQPISVPIYCVYSGNEKHAHKSGNNNDASESESVRSSKETGGGTTSSSSTCQKLCGTVDDFVSFNSNSCRRSEAYKCAEELATSSDDDYALPPDAVDLSSQELKIKCVAEDGARYDMTTSVKLSGYLNKLGNKTKTWKKRWFVLKDDALRYFRSQIDQDKKDPCGVINVSDIIGLSRLSGSSSTDGFEIITNKGRYCLSTEETGNTDEWFKSLQVCRKEAIAKKVKDKSQTCHVCGWLTKVYFGRSKRYWCVLSDSCLIFYKRPSAQLPKNQLCLSNVQIKEPPKSSEDESDGELIGQINYSYRQYSVEIVLPDHSITYLLFSTAEEKEKWMYHLILAANGGPKTNGSAFEFLVNKLMEVDGNS